MKIQLWQYALLRPVTWVPVGIGAWAILSRAWTGLGAALIVYGVYQALQLVNKTPDAAERIFLKQEKKRRDIQRKLNPLEQKHLIRILKYTRRLEKLGGDPNLGQEILNQAWLAIELNQDKNRNHRLEELIDSLPDLEPMGSGPQEDLISRLRKECEIIYASQAEANASSKSQSW